MHLVPAAVLKLDGGAPLLEHDDTIELLEGHALTGADETLALGHQGVPLEGFDLSQRLGGLRLTQAGAQANGHGQGHG